MSDGEEVNVDGLVPIDIPETDRAVDAPKRSIGRPFTKDNAREMGARGNWTKSRLAAQRKAYKVAVMEKLTPDNFAKNFLEAFERKDKDAMNAIIEASKFIGCHFDQSDEAVKNLNVKADVKKAGTVKLVIEDMTKPIEEA